ncbi:hypothetical protein [Hyalangium versicolor]|uniref:hypothetical protein n=1 Tax=Hyalangium versicolor TaxID=2861190 RepID=UPI001CCD2A90|nr:hypothetical protein [Hyalangium versicolor]
MKSSEDWSRLGGILIAAIAFILLVVVGPRMLGFAAGPEPEIITELKSLERDGVKFLVPGLPAPLTSREAVFDRITVQLEPGGQRAMALATLDFTGSVGDTEVSSLGVEEIPFVLRDGTWGPEGRVAPRLAAVVGALEARRRALDAGDGEALARLSLPPEGDAGGGEANGSVRVGELDLDTLRALQRRRYRADAWFIRLERDEAMVTEDWHLEGDLPSRPLSQQGKSRLILQRRGQEFLFSAALR